MALEDGVPEDKTPPHPFSAAFKAVPTYLMLSDQHDRVLDISTYFTDTKGLSLSDVEGQNVHDLLVEVPGEEANALHFVAGQTRFPVHMSRSEIPANADTDGHAIYLLTDVSEMNEMRSDLMEKAREAEEASRAKSRFLAAMSHEIRTPMNAILGFAQLLKLSHLDPKRRGHVNAIISAGGTLMNLLTDLLDLSRVEAGQLQIDARPFALQPVLDQLGDWWRSSATEKGLEFKLVTGTDLPEWIETDPVRLQQVLNNFLSNAIRYTDTGRVVLSASEVGRTQGVSRLRFEVSDTGVGMDDEERSRLFKPFVQIDSDFGKERGGWGLGLSICSTIADTMGATIDATSEKGTGSTFSFELDARIASPPPSIYDPPQAADIPGMDLPRMQILVAEDNVRIQDILRDFLLRLDQRPVVVSNGFEAIEALEDRAFDLVLMDIAMPGMGGLEATQQIRQSDTIPRNIPIIAVTADADAEVVSRYRNAGVDGFLPKPIALEALRDLIARYRKT